MQLNNYLWKNKINNNFHINHVRMEKSQSNSDLPIQSQSQPQPQPQTESNYLIKHLVISGGSYGGFIYYGVLKQLIKSNIIHLAQIDTLYGTSVGAYLIVIILMGYDWSTIDDYLIKRPWNSIFKFDMEHIVRSIQNGGLFNKQVTYDVFEPLFKGKDISLEITMKEFYELTQKEVHFFATDFQTLDVCDLSYKTHPEWKLLDAVYASSSLPIFFEPFVEEATKKLYLDGAVLLNYPLNRCLSDTNEYEHILGIYHNDALQEIVNRNPIEGNNRIYKLLDYLFMIVLKLWVRLKYKRTDYEKNLPHQIAVDFPIGFNEMLKASTCQYERDRLVKLGEQYAIDYKKKLNR